ncbi:hypothetical protein VDGD_04651 [Verticillium dahliae]|nr:hypothetical protein VDGD_04651 [Verticillium dahliae]
MELGPPRPPLSPTSNIDCAVNLLTLCALCQAIPRRLGGLIFFGLPPDTIHAPGSLPSVHRLTPAMKCYNPFGFRVGPVTFWTIIIYIALLVPLLWIHETVPPAPSSPTPTPGINLTEAWHDLTTITKHYHPYNSRDNERVGDYILERIATILDRNDVNWTLEKTGAVQGTKTIAPKRNADATLELSSRSSSAPSVTVFDDNLANVTWATDIGMLGDHTAGVGTYFEGTNKLVYIRGTEDEEGEWWKSGKNDVRVIGKGGVLVNAHYDSVASGYGATDDGMGCVSILQILNYFTTQGRQPKRGLLLLFNNGEEDGLLGAKAFANSPLFSFPTTFVNLEGAGAGGRAVLFRSSDEQVTKAYQKAPHPFGLVVASDGFSMGLVKSQTDFVVWDDIFGQRGLDIAFYRPRPRYHTDQDDTRHASPASLWHMLSNSIAAVKSLSDNTHTFSGQRSDGDRRKVPSGSHASKGVWFDMFGKGFAVFGLRGLFAWSLTLLIVSPLILAVIVFILNCHDKLYFFSRKINVHNEGSEDPVSIGGFRGFTRFPIAVGFSGALTLASAFLLTKINPMIVYSSEYAVWGMMLSLFYVSLWMTLKGSSAVRPSALQRGYIHIWLFIVSWGLLIVVAVTEDRLKIASGYPVVFLHSALFLSTVISFLELFGLTKKHDYARRAHDDHQVRDRISELPHDDALIAPGTPNDEAEDSDGDDSDHEPTETTPLRAGGDSRVRSTFGTAYRSVFTRKSSPDKHKPFDNEQPWSGRLPGWTWILQFLLLAPINVILWGQIGLFAVAATQAGGADGGSVLTTYLIIAVLSIVILVPLAPFIHRVHYYVPTILFAAFAGTLIYNLITFPFSANNRYKIYFVQEIDVSDGSTKVSLTGLDKYVHSVIGELPSTSGKVITCTDSNARSGLVDCSYDGSAVPPLLHDGLDNGTVTVTNKRYQHLVSVNITRSDDSKNRATLSINAADSKVCTVIFDQPVSNFAIRGSEGLDSRLGQYPDAGVGSLRLFRRDWTSPWVVDVEWNDEHKADEAVLETDKPVDKDTVEELRKRAGISGTIKCHYSDANAPETIPAFHECLQYSPDWAAFSKADVGLVRAVKRF